MPDELNLETGDPARRSSREERRRRRSSDSGTTGQRAAAKVEQSIREKLDKLFDRLVKMRRSRGDEELAGAIEEDAEDMAQGFLSITETFTPLRGPLIGALNFFLPLLAFTRVGRIVFMRWYERRLARRAEHEIVTDGDEAKTVYAQ